MFCWAFAAATLVISLLTIAGWAMDAPLLKGVAHNSVAMNPMTAIMFVMAAAALLLLRKEGASRFAIRAGRALATGVALVGLTKLGSCAIGVDFGVDRLLFQGELGGNQIAPNTAGLFLLVGATLLLLDFKTAAGFWPAEACACSRSLLLSWQSSATPLEAGFCTRFRIIFPWRSTRPLASSCCRWESWPRDRSEA